MKQASLFACYRISFLNTEHCRELNQQNHTLRKSVLAQGGKQLLNNSPHQICGEAKELIFIAICDVKPAQDEAVYRQMEKLGSSGGVTPLIIGRLFSAADVMLLLHSPDMELLDDYLIRNVRRIKDVQELAVVPIYEFKLLSSFDFMVEPEQEGTETVTPFEPEDLLFFMAKIDIEPTKDRAVYKSILSLEPTDEVIPLMTGHTFHSKDFDAVLFFLTRSLGSAWDFVKALRTIQGVWDTEVNLIAHFEGLVPLKKFKELASTRSVHRVIAD